MSTQHDYPRKASHPRTMDHTPLKMSSTQPSQSSRHPAPTTQRMSRRVPVPSASMPTHTSWLSDAGEFAPPAPDYLSVSIPSAGSLLGSGSLSDSGSPSRSPRARSRDRPFPSSSMSPQASGSGSFSRHSPVPPARTLHTSRSFSSASPLKTSAFSDRDASGHLDFKRLMSKPAKQSASASSMVSLPSDSERSASASASTSPSRFRRPSEPLIHPPSLKRTRPSPSPSREKLPMHVNTAGLQSNTSTRAVQGPTPERRSEMTDGQSSSKASRNVLRRRPSSRSNPSTPTAGHFQMPTDESYPPPRSTTSQHPPRSQRLTASMSARPTTSPAAERAATLPRKTSLSAASRSQQHFPSGLTPAGAVALAYKQQEQRREELAETASFNDAYMPSSTQSSVISASGFVRNDEAEEEGGEPYYTVFGSPTGRLVAVGSPVDDDWHVNGWETRATVAVPKPAPNRSLSRKVSGSFKRVAESMKREKEVRDPVARAKYADDWVPYDGQRNAGGRDSPTRQKASRKPLPLDTKLEERSQSPRGSPVPKGGSPNGSPSPQEDGRGSRASKSKGKEELSPGGMWSKLMKRISTGGLREKYTQSDEPPPPVPALPRDFAKAATATSRTTMEIPHTAGGDVSENGVLLRRFMQSRSSLSGVRPSAASTKASSSSSRPSTGTAGRPSTGNTTKSRASLGQRPRTRTRSSSPVSSEIASSGFFGHNHNRTPSTRSSFSSVGEELPPMPKNLGQYIVPPGELSRMTKSSEQSTPTPSRRSRKSSRSQSAPVEERVTQLSPLDGAVPSLPLPPRRATHEGSSVSPLSASFSSPEETGSPSSGPQPPPLAEFGMKEPPPRPKRSSRRMPPPNVDVPPRSQSMSATMPRSPATPRGPPPAVRVDVNLARSPSTGALSYASTARQVYATPSPSSGSITSPSSAASKKSPLTFRELESPRARLSEREKAAKWEDLLERSARAGGTLHIGDSGLLSEHPDVEGASVHEFDDL